MDFAGHEAMSIRWIGDVGLIKRRVTCSHCRRMPLHVALKVVGHDFVDLAVVERRAQPAGEPIDTPRRVPAERARDRRAATPRRVSIANRTERGKSGLEQQELGDALGPHVGGVPLAIRFEPRARRSSAVHDT